MPPPRGTSSPSATTRGLAEPYIEDGKYSLEFAWASRCGPDWAQPPRPKVAPTARIAIRTWPSLRASLDEEKQSRMEPGDIPKISLAPMLVLSSVKGLDRKAHLCRLVGNH